ncbi:MAG: winged helix-turn-helix transcriptional regulator [Candidatus Korarchaeota archaeon]|nr:winged helix-turn-helix transcriptional regulator [Candidatus Korarchaeota archaeon]
MISKRQLEILKELSEDGRKSISEIARKLGISHTAVRGHLEKLVRKNILSIKLLLNLNRLGHKVAIMLLEVDTIDTTMKIAEKFKECPRLIYLFQSRGSHNLIVIMAAESDEVLDSIAGSCMIRTCEGIRRSEILEITEPLVNPYLPVRLPSRKYEKAPCGADCANCKRYAEDSCLGCPAFKGYRGVIEPT